jgi:hypothetical protein
VVNVASGTIQVRASWDGREGEIEPKTRTSRRAVPMPGVLRDLMLDHRMRQGERDDDQLVFGAGGMPFHAATLYRRADDAWEAAGLSERLRLHQARHTYASFMIAAGVNAKALATYMGHSSIKVTFDLRAFDAGGRGRGSGAARRLSGAGQYRGPKGGDQVRPNRHRWRAHWRAGENLPANGVMPAACKAVYTGSIPVGASHESRATMRFPWRSTSFTQ